jgi:transcription elongation factor SPT6
MDFDEDELDWQPEVHFVVDDIASIFAKSPRADVELKDYTNVNIRKAISIGRFVQEPLAEVAYMWGGATDTSASIRGDEVLFLSLHPLFHKVNKSFLLGFLERELIITVNDAGVNLNAAIQNQHRHAQLSFVCGLGKIKAHDMVNKIKKMGGGMISRKVDLREKAIIGRLVFANAAGFLRIRDFPSVHLNPVDDTRIHPETYLPVEKD